MVSKERISRKWNNREHYADHVATLGKLLLLARRLCERGAGFVTVTTSFVWDMHADINNAHMTEGMGYVGAPFDHAVAAFLDDCEARGLSDKILLVCCGEMGRTPALNGAGAGAYPTASAVIADLVDVTRMHTADPENRVPHLAFQPDRMSKLPILPMAEVETSYYLRMRVHDKPGVLADITRILAKGSISIDAMVQKEPPEGEAHADIIMLTHQTVEKRINGAIAAIEKLRVVVGKVTRIGSAFRALF